MAAETHPQDDAESTSSDGRRGEHVHHAEEFHSSPVEEQVSQIQLEVDIPHRVTDPSIAEQMISIRRPHVMNQERVFPIQHLEGFLADSPAAVEYRGKGLVGDMGQKRRQHPRFHEQMAENHHSKLGR